MEKEQRVTQFSETPVESWRDRLFTLLCAVADACEASDIKYFLYGRTALLAYRDGALCDYPEISIDIHDVDRFARVIKRFGRKSGVLLDGMDETPFFRASNTL